ncbi:MAG: ribosome hibernation-promoting factor, HPF/YfiA family [Candidatus Sericytochromatia bacterium]
MDLVIKGKNMDVTDSLRDYAQQKLGRITKILDGIIDAQVEFNVIKNKRVANDQIVEVTLHLSGGVIRAEEAKDNMYAAIDLVTDKVERQLKRFKGKHNSYDRTKTSSGVLEIELEVPVTVVNAEEFEEERDDAQIVRNKQIEVNPMSPEEAARQLEMLGHDFYVFRNSESKEVNVLYHRRDGHYGLIEPVNS